MFKCFIHVKIQFRDKNPVLRIEEISISCSTQEGDNVTTPHYPIYALLSVKSLTGG